MSILNQPTSERIKVKEQSTYWMRFDNQTFVTEDNLASILVKPSGYGYRKVHYTAENQKNKTMFGFGKDKIFFDQEWDIRQTQNLKSIDPNHQENIVLRRLGHLYPTNQNLRPKFFPTDNYNEPVKKVEDLAAVPHFLHEVGMFPASYYKSLFFTQKFQASGMYSAVINYNGRWQTDVVDDLIPVYQKSGKPIWGMDLQQPWQIILLKFWAKRNFVLAKQYGYNMAEKGGYAGVKNAAPFEFINTFSNANWKFINLDLELQKFLRDNVNNVHKGHFILKSKNSSHVKESGLIPNQACYEIVNLIEQGEQKTATSGLKDTSASKTGKKQVKYIATIRSSNKHQWTGKKSIVDPEFKNCYKDGISRHSLSSKIRQQGTVNDTTAEQFGLDRCFTIEAKDLKNLFSCCYVAPRRIGNDFVSSYYKFAIPAKSKKAVYLQFDMPRQGFFDFSIRQLPSNKLQPSKQSKVKMEEHNQEHGDKVKNNKIERYLRNRYILVKDNLKSQTWSLQEEFQKDYNRLNYEAYQIENLKGYNSGTAHFLKTVKGRYILRIKSETHTKEANYVVNYCSNSEIKIKHFEPSVQQETRIMKDAMASTIDKVKRITLKQKDQTQIVAYGNTFDYVGYGYVGVKLKKSSKMQVLIDIDPKQLEQEGFKLKHAYKNQKQPFAILVKAGQATAIVLKRINEDPNHVWPPKGIAVFQKASLI